MAYSAGNGKGDRITSDTGKMFAEWGKKPGRYSSAPRDAAKLKRRAAGYVLPQVGRPRTTHCKRGHERTDENTYWKRSRRQPNGRTRDCKLCVRMMEARRDH